MGRLGRRFDTGGRMDGACDHREVCLPGPRDGPGAGNLWASRYLP
jgi:hypothetical protein